jgi:hypothetical protein
MIAGVGYGRHLRHWKAVTIDAFWGVAWVGELHEALTDVLSCRWCCILRFSPDPATENLVRRCSRNKKKRQGDRSQMSGAAVLKRENTSRSR